LIEIQTPQELTALRPLFAAMPTAFFLEAMIAGNCAFRAWTGGGPNPSAQVTDGTHLPQSALVWDGRSLLFPVGRADEAAFQDDLSFLFGEIILPQAGARGQDAFLFHTSSPEWDAVITPLLPGFTCNRYPRVIYEEVQAAPGDWRERVPHGFEVRPIDRRLLGRTSLEGMESLVEEIEECWPSRKRFLEKGFGAAVLEGRKIVSRITAEYVYPGHVGIGIATEERYRGRGLAPLATAAFIEMCNQRGLAPHWDAWKNNLPSVRAAEKAGFRDSVEYTGLLVYRE
jgi:RimJ/RimL family protein N-acetyltransferase